MTTSLSDELPEGVASRTINSYGVVDYWDTEGKLHNPDGPATIHPDKPTYRLVTGRDPSEIGDGWFHQQRWFFHGMLHRTDGPAVEWGDGSVEYWVNGESLTADEFHQRFTDSRKL